MEVANNLEVDETIVMKRWGNLRERFSKEIRSSRNTSGSGASVGRQWALLENLQFLRGHIIPRPMRQSAPIFENSVEEDISSDFLNLSESQSPVPVLSEQSTLISLEQSTSISPAQSNQPAPSTYRVRKRKAAQLDELDTTILETVKTFQEVCARKARREEFSGEISSFGSMICSAISNMKKPTQALVIRRCTDIVMQAQIDEHQEVEKA